MGSWVKIDMFSIFWPFSKKLMVAERVLRPVAMLVGAGNSVDGCDSKSAPNCSLFGCMVTAGGCGSSAELALVQSVESLGTASSEAS